MSYKLSLINCAICLISLEIFNSFLIIEFYILIELMTLIIFINIIILGYNPERLKASIYLISYTFIRSFIFIIILIIIMTLDITLDCRKLEFYINYLNNNFIRIIIFIPLLIKYPMYIFHYWLPKAHVEATVDCSIFLAAIMLKLAAYGLFIIQKLILNILIQNWLICLGVIGILNLSLNLFNNSDFKKIIAYSRVIHISAILIFSIFNNNNCWYIAIIILISHSFRSSAMFFISRLIFSKLYRRNIIFFKNCFTMNSWIKFKICILSIISIPPRLAFFGEVIIFKNLFSFFYSLILIPLLIVVLIYPIYLIFLLVIVIGFYSSNKNYSWIESSRRIIIIRNYLLFWIRVLLFI